MVLFSLLMKLHISASMKYIDCSDAKDNMGDEYRPGLHTLNVSGRKADVICDEDGWTVIQARGQYGNPADFFFKGWKDYVEGFGERSKPVVLHAV